MPFPTGFLCLIDKLIKASVTDWEINSKLFVSPLIIQPRAITPSNFLIYFSIIKGIMGVRVSPEEESEGLDLAEHGQSAYNS